MTEETEKERGGAREREIIREKEEEREREGGREKALARGGWRNEQRERE